MKTAIHEESGYEASGMKLTAIENWLGLLEEPTKSCIFLAEDNWQAR